jgi:hypothetical protein
MSVHVARLRRDRPRQRSRAAILGALSLCISFVSDTGVAAAQGAPTATTAAVCSFSAVDLLGGAPLAAATLTADGLVAVVSSDAAIALVSTQDCSVLAQAAHVIAGVQVVLVTDAGRVVVVGDPGVWVWEPGLTASRSLLSERTSAAIHAGGEAVVVAVETVTGEDLLLRRIDARTGRVTRGRAIPARGEARSRVDSLGWDVRDGSLLVLTAAGDLLRSRAASLSRPTLLASYGRAVEHRDTILTEDGRLVYEVLGAQHASFFVSRISQDGRRAVLASLPTFGPTASPSYWMLWRPGSALPRTVTGPAAPSPFHRVDAVAPTGRTLFCEHAHTSQPDEAERSRERCWVLDL